MKVEPGELQRVAQLSGLTIRPEQFEQMVGDVQSILELLSAITDAEGTSEPYRPGPGASPFRADVPTPDRCLTDVGAIAPESRDGFILTPRPPGVLPE